MAAGRWRRVAGRLSPTLVAVAVAAVVAGLADAIATASDGANAVVGIGFSALVAVPVGVVLALIARAVFAAWRFDRLRQGWTDERGGMPRLAGWLLTILACTVAGTFAVDAAVGMVVRRTTTPAVIALAAALIAAVIGLLLIGVSRPVADALSWLVARADRALSHERSRLRLPVVIGGAAAAAIGCGLLLWACAISPRVGALELDVGVYPIAFVVSCIAAHLAWPVVARQRRGRVAGAAAVAAAVVAMAAAVWIRHARPLVMLEVWGDSGFAGLTVDKVYSVEDIRDQLDLGEIAPEARRGAPHPDIILITVDTMRADRTPPYGGPASMPALAALARRAIVFDWTLAPSNVTRRSMPAMMMGLSPGRLRGRVVGWALKLDPRHILLAERLAAAGYETAGFFCCDSHFGPARRLGLSRGVKTIQIKKSGRELTRMAIDWLSARQGRADRPPLFLWIHYFDMHVWENTTAKVKTPTLDPRAKRLWRYDWVLNRVDTMLAELVRALDQQPAERGRIIVLTSDHGEALGDHGFKTHATSLYNAELRVPLIIAGTGLPPRTIERPVGLVDLAPTLIELAGYVPPGMPAMDGVSLGPLLRGDSGGKERPVHSAMVKDRSVASGARSVVAGGFKLIQRDAATRPELYDMAADAAESRNLAADRPEKVKQLQRALADRARLDAIRPF